MTEDQDKIVVFEGYENVIQASLAKTKLDAFGVPCFLTGENFGSQFPFKNELFPGIQLYIFRNDWDRVREILKEGTEPSL